MTYAIELAKYAFNTNKNVRNILLCGDKKYIRHIGVTITSICENTNSNNWGFYVFCDTIEDVDLERLKFTADKYKINIYIYTISKSIISKFSEDTGNNTHISVAAYFRFIAFGALKNNIKSILYLDSDICVIDDKLEYFWKIDLNDKVAAVIGKPHGDPTEIRLNIEQAFNSGVIFVDIEKWNELDLTTICIKKACEKVWPMLDQDVLNIVLDRKFVSVPNRFNYEYSLSYLIDNVPVPSKVIFTKSDATVLHYIGASKPWHTWVQCCEAVKLYSNIKYKSFWKKDKLDDPDTIKKQTYKYWHKAARVAKKERLYKDMINFYIKYIIRKLGL